MAAMWWLLGVVAVVQSLHWQSFPKVSEPQDFFHGTFTDDLVGRRLLSDTINNPVYIPFGNLQANVNYTRRAYAYVFDSLSTSQSNFILYPYSFTRPNGDVFPQGSVIDVEAVTAPTVEPYNFSWIANDSSIVLSKAQALYDVAIAILQIQSSPYSNATVYTPEGKDYCAPFSSYTGKYSQCFSSTDAYKSALKATPTSAPTAVVYINETDLQGNFLSLYGFDVLIFPDIAAGQDQTIINKFGGSGQQNLVNWVSNGGSIFASGKAGLLLQNTALGLFPAGIFDPSLELSANGYAQTTTGCADTLIDFTSAEDDYAAHTLCFGLPVTNGTQGVGIYDSLISALTVTASVGNVKILSYWNTGAGTILKRPLLNPSGSATTFLATDKVPHTLYQRYGQGHVVANLGNPVQETRDFAWIFNFLFLAGSKPVLVGYENNFPWAVIPALEQFNLGFTVSVTNLFNVPLDHFSYKIWVAAGLILNDVPSGCTQQPATAAIAPKNNNTALNTTYFLDCSGSQTLGAFEHIVLNISIFINDVLITQNQFNILFIYPIITYNVPFLTNTSNVEQTQTVALNVVANAYMAASIVSDFNPDPIAIYPVPGAGAFVDNVMNAENKDDTLALSTYHIGMIPLVTPLVDDAVQSAVTWKLDYDYLYYKQQVNGVDNYTFPWLNPGSLPGTTVSDYTASNPRPHDFLDYALLSVRSSILAADWDVPVHPQKQVRTSKFPSVYATKASVPGGGLLTTLSLPNAMVINQTAFYDADSFYQFAGPRQEAFLDLGTSEGLASYLAFYGNSYANIDTRIYRPAVQALKRELVLLQNNIYFYTTVQNLPLPQGISNYSAVLSLDRYQATQTCSNGNLGTGGALRAVPGYYDDQTVDGMRAHEYTNGILSYCDRRANRINLTDPNLSATTGGGLTLTHYIVRLDATDVNATEGGHGLMFFAPNTSIPLTSDPEWYYAPGSYNPEVGATRFGDYPEVRAVYVFGADYELNPNQTRQGGRVTITLPATVTWGAGVDPVAAGYITQSPDLIAITETSYNPLTHQITYKFYRGQMPDEAYGENSQIQINLERLANAASLPTNGSFVASIAVEELIYDLTQPLPYEAFVPQILDVVVLTFSRIFSLALPALKTKFSLDRTFPNVSLSSNPELLPTQTTGKNSFMYPYESLEPYVRYGVYSQEIKSHRTVYASAQFNPISDTGIVVPNGAMSYITHVGTSSIPFRNYLTHGTVFIPASTETARVEWNDIWGRQWVEPIRSVFVDVVPLPGPLRNFMMTTTFEILNPTTTQRYLEWRSDDTVTIRAQVKLLNNYNKWFEIAHCYENEIFSWDASSAGQFFPGVNPPTDQLSASDIASGHKDYVWYRGVNARYGYCFADPNVYLEGQLLSAQTRQDVNTAQFCFENFTSTCQGIVGTLPVLERRPTGNNVSIWNFAEQVDQYWPNGYIAPDMWDLTHWDYDDSPFVKSYPYHFDNLLPSFDNAGLKKPENIIAFPIYKGLGYLVSYSNATKHVKFPGYQGWWSDQLQNKDDTVLAGQATANVYSVGSATDLAAAQGWIPITDLTVGSSAPSTSATNVHNQALGVLTNAYACEFNRVRVGIDPANHVTTYPANIFYHNVVPIDPTYTAEDPRLFNYKCDLSKGQASYSNISLYPNYVATGTAVDYLYFGSNLRGGAKENVNVLYTMAPGPNPTKQEGTTTVSYGGTFVYWNPGCGPNCFLVVDDNVMTVQALTTNISIQEELFPDTIPTFKAIVFQLLTISDTAEINRQWPLPIYTNSYGFGDATITMYVGGTFGTSSNLNPGDTTQIQISLWNNAGFDWVLKPGAIPSISLGSKAINAFDLMNGQTHSIQDPTVYEFLTPQIPEELQPYINLTTSNFNIDTPPMQFDFQNINVFTIRDGFRGTYSYQLTLSPKIPDSFRGRLYHIPIVLNTSWFEAYPGQTSPSDPILPKGFHDYTLAVPDIVFGIPYASDSPWAGGVYYTSGYGSNLVFNDRISPYFTPVGAKLVTPANVDQLRSIASNPDQRQINLEAFWQSLTASENVVIPFPLQAQSSIYSNGNPDTAGGNTWDVQFNLSAISPTGQFPIPQQPSLGPDIAQIYILLKLNASQVYPLWNAVSPSLNLAYQDFAAVTKTASLPTYEVYAAGAYLRIQWSYIVCDLEGKAEPVQSIEQGSEDQYILNVTLVVRNIGTDVAYRLAISTLLGPDVKVPAYIGSKPYTPPATLTPYAADSRYLEMDYTSNLDLAAGSFAAIQISLELGSSTDGEGITYANGVRERIFALSALGTIDLTSTPGEVTVQQNLSYPLMVALGPAAPIAVTNSTPVWKQGWFIALVVILSVLFLLFLLLLLLLLRRRREKDGMSMMAQETSTSSVVAGQAPPASKKQKKMWKKQGEKDPGSYHVKHYAINSEYIMEGVVNVKIVDVDPSAREARQKEADEKKGDLAKAPTSSSFGDTVTTKKGWRWYCLPQRGADGSRRCCCCGC